MKHPIILDCICQPDNGHCIGRVHTYENFVSAQADVPVVEVRGCNPWCQVNALLAAFIEHDAMLITIGLNDAW